MDIIFSYPMNWIALAVTGTILCLIVYLSIISKLNKKKILSLISTILFCILLFILALFPALIFKLNTSLPKKINIFIDCSLSMKDGAKYNNKSVSLFNRSIEIVDLIKNISPIPVQMYSGSDSMQEFSHSLQYNANAFNIQSAFDESLNSDTLASIIITDGARLKTDAHYSGSHPVYLLNPESQPNDLYIQNVSEENDSINIKIINRSPFNNSLLTVKSGKNILYSQNIQLKKNTNIIRYHLPRSLSIKEPVLQFEIKAPGKEENLINNVYYLYRKSAEPKVNVNLYLSTPSFDSRFLLRFLEQSRKYSVTAYFPRTDGKLFIPKNIPANTIEILMDINGATTSGIENLNRRVQNGAIVLFFYRETTHGNNSGLRSLLPFTSAALNENNRNAYFSITPEGEKFPFIHLRDRSSAAAIWKNFQGIAIPRLKIIPKPETRVLLNYGNNPAILLSQFGKGKVIASLPYPLWKMDFPSQGYGIETHYLSIFFNDILAETVQNPSKLVHLPYPVIHSGEELQVIIHPSLAASILKGKKHILLKGAGMDRILHFTSGGSMTSAKTRLYFPGEYSLYISGEAHPAARAYVNYPQEEMSDGNNRMTFKKIASLNKRIKWVTENELSSIIKKIKPALIYKQTEKHLIIFSTFLSAILLFGILFMSWFFRMRG